MDVNIIMLESPDAYELYDHSGYHDRRTLDTGRA
jgi:hypothetical protein